MGKNAATRSEARKSPRRVAAIGMLAAATLLLLGGLAWAWKSEPRFYGGVLEISAEQAQTASDRLLERLGALTSDVRRDGPWEALLTQDDLNGYLAHQFDGPGADTLPAGMARPRVAVDERQLVVACRYGEGLTSCVLSLAVEPYLVDREAIAVRVQAARLGRLPLPLGRLLDSITQAAERSGWRLTWRLDGGRPCAVVRPDLRAKGGARRTIESLSLLDGQLFVAGQTIVAGRGATRVADARGGEDTGATSGETLLRETSRPAAQPGVSAQNATRQ